MKLKNSLFILFSIFLLTAECSLSSTFLSYFGTRDTFQIDQGCTGTKCVGEGQSCIPAGTIPAECKGCMDTFSFCEKDALNGTELCGCYEDYVDCLEKLANFYCDAYTTQKSCLSLMNGTGIDCSCGTATQRTYTINNCAYNLRCDNSTKTCAKQLGEGAPCSSNSDCGDGNYSSSKSYICNPTTSKCELLPGWAGVGDACTKNTDCHNSGQYVKCTSGVCVGVSAGGTCSDSSDCAFNLYCDPTSLTCANAAAEGAQCNSTYNLNCQTGSICGFEGTCIKLFSKGAGSSCNSYEECNIGLYCDGSSKLCSAVPEKRSCSKDSECVGIGNAVCECGFDGAKKCQFAADYYSSECSTSISDLNTCMVENQCKELTIADGSCVTSKCATQTNCFAHCFIQQEENNAAEGCFGSLPSCPQSTTGSDTGGSSVMAPISAILIVTATVLTF